MTETVSLTLKIDPVLKETLKAIALENQTSVSQEVTRRLLITLEGAKEPEVDNQDTAEELSEQLSAAELKQVRALLKKSKKKK
ncbi:hypothetical protein IBT47_05825 [Erwinia sp. S43]|uniref:Arc-like DNA binding domain-containing protein n=1 Tax=Pantoea coffeiphila TaxID=1465635 RepID=A0A2S9IGW4_9GAMM|nr:MULTISPECIES: hypothetical protein [Erwiniaceae]MBK0000384.1 hypothetical protein [Erwinia sp. S38]MBK0031799.1 hypothetical protein [Erwinia sp. S43]MBM7345357.1 regulatory protein YycH of two-component signal transduction system YycFG [Pantoea coffeiphila]MCW1877262.1 hypothetical protein [Erwinia sp. INIA01]PRD17020.1 hypothetical protein CQW29_05040 [Pantoea coffeiphila]